jgi:hypothetical protein
MEKRILVLGLVIILFLAGCAAQKAPEVVCNKPYIKYGASCCMDQNDNSICDDDEDVLFEPDYSPVKDVADETEDLEEPVYQQTEPVVITPEPEKVKQPEQVESKYVAPPPKLSRWDAENEYMSIEVTKIGIDVVPIKPKDLISPDKEVYLKYMVLVIKNKDYNYLNPKISLRLWDNKNTVFSEKLECDASDDMKVEGCDNALEEGMTMTVKITINEKIPRFDTEKTIRINLENRRDIHSENVLEIKKEVDILDIWGATYS